MWLQAVDAFFILAGGVEMLAILDALRHSDSTALASIELFGNPGTGAAIREATFPICFSDAMLLLSDLASFCAAGMGFQT